MKSMNLVTVNKNRLEAILERGDEVGAVVFHKGGGFSCRLKITAVHHWGVYAILRGKDLDYYCKNKNESYREEVGKRQFLIKWRWIHNIQLN